MSVHIYPLNDTDTHTLDFGCACGPTRDRNGYWIHPSFDGREDHPNNGTPPLNWTFEITDNE